MDEGMPVAEMVTSLLFFTGCGVAIGAVLVVVGKPWWRILTVGGAGAAIGLLVALFGLCAWRVRRDEEQG